MQKQASLVQTHYITNSDVNHVAKNSPYSEFSFLSSSIMSHASVNIFFCFSLRQNVA